MRNIFVFHGSQEATSDKTHLIISKVFFLFYSLLKCAWTADSVQRPATGWRVRGSKIGEGRVFPHPGAHPAPIKCVLCLFLGGKAAGARL